MYQSFAGLERIGNLTVCIFGDHARDSLPDWDLEAAIAASTLEARAGARRRAVGARTVLAELQNAPRLPSPVDHHIDITYYRDPAAPLRIHHRGGILVFDIETSTLVYPDSHTRVFHGVDTEPNYDQARAADPAPPPSGRG